MHIDILTVIPDFFQSPLHTSILKRAQEKNLIRIEVHDLKRYAPAGRVDDYPYGGGAGMVIRIEPLVKAYKTLTAQRLYDEVIYLTPDGERLTQSILTQLSLKNTLLLIAGHYKGIDQRFRDAYITREISIGDYVLTGGEIPALVLIDGITRLLPGVLGDSASALEDSFQDGLLAPPIYTRPRVFEGHKVPDILLSGNHEAIRAWRYQKALERTQQRRPDLFSAQADAPAADKNSPPPSITESPSASEEPA
ncbi:MAG: tRNA (guanosine(37)-N1)-methyltransferase TrmD [Bacteroidia bacterium]